MPFKSEKQRRYLWAKYPKIARKFISHSDKRDKILNKDDMLPKEILLAIATKKPGSEDHLKENPVEDDYSVELESAMDDLISALDKKDSKAAAEAFSNAMNICMESPADLDAEAEKHAEEGHTDSEGNPGKMRNPPHRPGYLNYKYGK